MSSSATTDTESRTANFPPDPIDLSYQEMALSHPRDPAISAEAFDRSFHAALARFTGGLSPAALALAFADWQLHLLSSPGK